MASRPPRAAPVRPFWVALVACAVLLGAVDYHPAGEGHSFAELPEAAGSSFSHAALHPGQPVHLEPSEVVTRPHCPVCLHRLQTSGGHLLAAIAMALPALASTLPTDYRFAFTDESRLARPARAPPAV
jgi:hypothetical protein